LLWGSEKGWLARGRVANSATRECAREPGNFCCLIATITRTRSPICGSYKYRRSGVRSWWWCGRGGCGCGRRESYPTQKEYGATTTRGTVPYRKATSRPGSLQHLLKRRRMIATGPDTSRAYLIMWANGRRLEVFEAMPQTWTRQKVAWLSHILTALSTHPCHRTSFEHTTDGPEEDFYTRSRQWIVTVPATRLLHG
jgi:hypothetical protein